MYTNYPNTEQITQKNDPKGSTPASRWIKLSLLAEVLQVCDVIWYDQVNRDVIWYDQVNPHVCCFLHMWN